MKVLKSLFSAKTRNRTITFVIVILLYVIMSAMMAAGSVPRMISSLLVPVCCYIVAAIGLNLNVGFSGELNLGQAGFMSVGGFTAAIVNAVTMSAVPNDIIRLILCIICGAVMAGVIGWLISIPVLKLEGDYLAIVTLAFGQIIMSLINNLYIGMDEAGLHFAFITNNISLGESGKMIISGPMGVTGNQMISTFTAGFILILVSLVIVYNLMFSKEGRAIQACRDNKIAAETVGIKVASTKTLAFVLSSALGGAAGALYMMNYSSVAATKFDFNTSILILVYVVLGGLGNMTGTVIATTVLVMLPEMLRFLSSYRMLVYAIVLVVMMIVTNNEKVIAFTSGLKRRMRKGD
ncbi:MAG: branched-chain amino acid ABC transporter permease [Bulleidia sp.]